MRKSNVLIAAGLIAIVVLGVWLWPSGDEKKTSDDNNVAAASKAMTLEERREARRSGSVSTAPASISGIVVEQGSEQPIVGALISLSPRKIEGGMISQAGQSPAPVITRSDAKGRFRISGLRSGEFSLSASANGYKPQAQDSIALEAGRDRNDLKFSLARGGHQLRGVVSDIGGGAIPFAQVRATQISGFTISTLFRAPFTARTDDNGNYVLNLEDGRYQVSLFHEDYQHDGRQVIINGSDRNADFVLTPGSVIEGVVLRSSDDSPVADALVTVMPAGRGGGFVVSGIAFEGGAQTDAEGHFTLGGLGSGAFDIRAVAKHSSSRQPSQVELGIAESLTDVVVYVDDAYTLSGFVVDRDDESIAEPGVLVGAYNFSPGAVFASSTPSASDGYFEIHGVHPGTYTLGAAAEERPPTFFGETITVVDEDISDLTVKVKKGATLRGTISPPQVTQLHLRVSMDSMGISTMLQAAGSLMVNGKSNEDGEFELKGVSNGEYTLVARSETGDKGTLDISVSESMDGLEVQMQERASAEGVVVDASGQPVEGVTVDFNSDEASPMSSLSIMRPGPEAITGPDGRFVHVGLEDGGYNVVVRDGPQLAWAGKEEKAAYVPERIEVKNGADIRGMRLAIVSRNETIRGSVVNSDGAPVTDAWVTAKYIPDANSSASVRWSSGEAPVLTDDGGRFAVTGLREGKYSLKAEGMRGGSKGEIESTGTGSDVTITLAALGSIGGKVSKAGSPVTDFVISASGPTRRRAHIVNDSGEFQLRRLEPGEYRLEVTSINGAATAKATVKTGEESRTAIALAAFGSISGVLVDSESGDPMVGISVAATTGDSGSKWAENTMEMLQGNGPTTDEEGRFRVGKLGSGKGEVYFVDPKAKGFGLIIQQEFELAPGESKDLGEITASLPSDTPNEDKPKGTIGVATEIGKPALCAGEASAEGLEEDSQHLWIISVVDGGPADKAGIKPCDRITTFEDFPLTQGEGGIPLQVVKTAVEAPSMGSPLKLGLKTGSGAKTVLVDPIATDPEEPTPQ